MWGDTYFFNSPITSIGSTINNGETSTAPKNTDIMAAFENYIRFMNPNEASKVDSQVQRYLQTPHIPRAYDLNSLNILINIFMRHITPMFRSFDGFRIDEHTLPEQILGSAAIGALFSLAPGSIKVARLLYADCSRMVHSYVGTSFDSYRTMSRLTVLLSALRSQTHLITKVEKSSSDGE